MEKNIETAYQHILQHHQNSQGKSPGENHRTHPRFRVKSDDLWIASVPDFTLLDMSASGMAIRSNYPLDKGQLIEVSLGDEIRTTATVVDCQLVSSADEWTDADFRISCHYTEDLRGKEILVKSIQSDA